MAESTSGCLRAGPAPQGGTKKKRVIKLSRKQLKRKQLNRVKGEAIANRLSTKLEKDNRRFEKRIAAKELW